MLLAYIKVVNKGPLGSQRENIFAPAARRGFPVIPLDERPPREPCDVALRYGCPETSTFQLVARGASRGRITRGSVQRLKSPESVGEFQALNGLYV